MAVREETVRANGAQRESPFLGGKAGLAMAAAVAGAIPLIAAFATRTYLLSLAAPIGILALFWAASSDRARRLAAQLRLKDDFVAMVSHEIRTPLTSIQGSVKTMLRMPDLEDDERRRFLEAVDRQSDRLRRLVDRLMLLQQLDAGAPEAPSFTRVPLRSLCEFVMYELRGRAGLHELRLDFEPELIEVETDEVKVHEILSNLVENAIKYSDRDSAITIRCRADEESVALWVEDRGPGIPSDLRERAFERFFRVGGSSARGSGLGLYICRRLADAIGAEIWLDDMYEGGCRFFLRLPRKADASKPSDDLALKEEELIRVV